jgi:hypothetical protein
MSFFFVFFFYKIDKQRVEQVLSGGWELLLGEGRWKGKGIGGCIWYK